MISFRPVISLELIDIGQRVSMLTISRLFEMEDYSQPHVPGLCFYTISYISLSIYFIFQIPYICTYWTTTYIT